MTRCMVNNPEDCFGPCPCGERQVESYQGVRCMCVLTGCRAGPGCPHYGHGCKAHIAHIAHVRATGSAPQQAEPGKDSAQEQAYKSCRMDDGRCGICGGDWSVCGCDGMLRRAARNAQGEING